MRRLTRPRFSKTRISSKPRRYRGNCPATHAAHDVVGLEERLPRLAGEPALLIGMQEQSGPGTLPSDRHGERLQDQLRRDLAAHRQADHLTGVQIYEYAQE